MKQRKFSKAERLIHDFFLENPHLIIEIDAKHQDNQNQIRRKLRGNAHKRNPHDSVKHGLSRQRRK